MESEFWSVALSFGKLTLVHGSVCPCELLMCLFSWDLSHINNHIPKIESDKEDDTVKEHAQRASLVVTMVLALLLCWGAGT